MNAGVAEKDRLRSLLLFSPPKVFAEQTSQAWQCFAFNNLCLASPIRGSSSCNFLFLVIATVIAK
jgi:hypothetical protein